MLRKILRFSMWSLLVLIALVIFFYAEEDWRGAHDWAVCQKELQARGETLDLQQLAPSGKPENDITKVPIFAELFQDDNSKARLSHFGVFIEKSVSDDALPGNWLSLTEGRPLNLALWQKYYRSAPESWLPQKAGTPAQDVLARLSHFDPEMAEIDSTLHNREAYWPLKCAIPYPTYSATFQRGFVFLINDYSKVASVLQLQGVAHLENGEPEKAEQNFLFVQRLVQSLFRAPFLVNKLVASGVQMYGEGLLWEGIRRHAWKDEQLSHMETSMASVDFLENYRDALRFERGADIQCLSFVEQKQPIPVPYRPGEKYKSDEMILFTGLAPQGRIDQAKSYFCREIQKWIDAIDSNRGILDAGQFAEGRKFLMVLFLDLQGLVGAGHRAAEAETYLRMGRLACFLERYYLKQGHYPEKLDELSDLPPRLNQEVLSEKPFHYQLKGNGYLLYAVGWDGIDHGGVPTGPRVEHGETVGNADYDWVWPSP